MRRVDSLEKTDAGRDWGQEEKGMTEDEMAGWHHQLDGHEFEWTPGVGDGQGGLACCDSWGHKESDTTERLNWTELKGIKSSPYLMSLCFLPLQRTHFSPFFFCPKNPMFQDLFKMLLPSSIRVVSHLHKFLTHSCSLSWVSSLYLYFCLTAFS